MILMDDDDNIGDNKEHDDDIGDVYDTIGS